MAKPELRDHRKFLKLKRLLNAPTPHVIGYLDCLWHRGYQTGSAYIGDELDVEAAAEYVGEPGTFTAAAYECGFLDRLDDGNYVIHDLYDHAPRYARLRMSRKGNKPKARTSVRAQRTDGAQARTPRARSGSKRAVERQSPPRSEILDPRSENLEPITENPSPKQVEDKDIAATPPVVVETKIRPRDPIWDALVEVTGIDATIKANASHVGKVKKELLGADKPYTADEILSLPTIAAVHMPWTVGRALTLGEIQKNIGLVRAHPPPVRANGRSRSEMENFLNSGNQ